MMNDIYNACKASSDGLPNSEAFVFRSAMEDKSYELPKLYATYSKGSVTGSVKRGVEVGVSFAIANQTRYDLNRLGLLNPWEIAWELVPLSFVFDWFMPVGNFLSSFTASLGTVFKTGYTTTWLENNFTAKYPPFGNVGFHSGKMASVNYRTKSMRRSLLTSFPIPIPYFDPNLDISKILSGLALIVASRP
jgi:hypothetical protein